MGADAQGVSGGNESASAQSPDFDRKLHIYLANLNEQAQSCYRHLVRQMAENEGITEDLKRQSQWVWVKAMNSVASRAEEMVKSEMINV